MAATPVAAMPCEATDHSASLDQPMMDLVPEPKVEEALGLNQLPSELLLMVLSQVPPRMLIRHCRQVCRRWRALVDCQDLWLIILARDHRALWPVLQSCLPPADDTRPSVLGRFCVRRPLHQNLFRDPKGEEDFQKRPRVSREEEVALKEKWQGVIRRAGWKNSFRYLYRWFEKKQVVDLQEEGLWPELLDSGKIEIWVSDWATPKAWRFPDQGSNWSCSHQPTLQTQQHQIQATSSTYTTAHSNARSLTY